MTLLVTLTWRLTGVLLDLLRFRSNCCQPAVCKFVYMFLCNHVSLCGLFRLSGGASGWILLGSRLCNTLSTCDWLDTLEMGGREVGYTKRDAHIECISMSRAIVWFLIICCLCLQQSLLHFICLVKQAHRWCLAIAITCCDLLLLCLDWDVVLVYLILLFLFHSLDWLKMQKCTDGRSCQC